MKYLFWGETEAANGPGMVNRGFHAHLSRDFLRPDHKNRYLRLAQGMMLLLRCRVLVVSGISRQGCILAALAALTGKRTVCILHGSARREGQWHPNRALERQEAFLMARAHRLLCVSRMFRDWVRETYPQYAGKTGYLYPGVELPAADGRQRSARSVAAAGGDGGIKGNDVLIRAVEMTEGVELTLYGPVKHTEHSGPVRCAGRVPRQEFWQGLSETALFVLNSRFESFSLSALEALRLGCSLLISEKAGAAELLCLEKSDVIRDPENAEALSRQIAWLLEHPNNRRLAASVDWQALTWDRACVRLEQICRDLAGRDRP